MRGVVLAIPAMAWLVAACGEEETAPTPSPSPTDRQAEASAKPAPSPTVWQPAPPSGGSMEFETIDKGSDSGVAGAEPQVLKINTEAEWGDFWGRHKTWRMPNVPSVDFPHEMVIAVVDEVEPSGGYDVKITGIEAGSDALIVLVSKAVPGPDCIVTQALTQPFHIVRTKNLGMMLDLVITEETVSCE